MICNHCAPVPTPEYLPPPGAHDGGGLVSDQPPAVAWGAGAGAAQQAKRRRTAAAMAGDDDDGAWRQLGSDGGGMRGGVQGAYGLPILHSREDIAAPFAATQQPGLDPALLHAALLSSAADASAAAAVSAWKQPQQQLQQLQPQATEDDTMRLTSSAKSSGEVVLESAFVDAALTTPCSALAALPPALMQQLAAANGGPIAAGDQQLSDLMRSLVSPQVPHHPSNAPATRESPRATEAAAALNRSGSSSQMISRSGSGATPTAAAAAVATATEAAAAAPFVLNLRPVSRRSPAAESAPQPQGPNQQHLFEAQQPAATHALLLRQLQSSHPLQPQAAAALPPMALPPQGHQQPQQQLPTLLQQLQATLAAGVGGVEGGAISGSGELDASALCLLAALALAPGGGSISVSQLLEALQRLLPGAAAGGAQGQQQE